MSMHQGLLIVISGPAGSGKGTMLNHIFASPKHAAKFAYSVSATTRDPRPGEVDGVNYHFLTREDFEARICPRFPGKCSAHRALDFLRKSLGLEKENVSLLGKSENNIFNKNTKSVEK